MGREAADIVLREAAGRRVLHARGRLDIAAVARLWPRAMRAAEAGPIAALDLAEVEALDSAGAVMLLTAAPEAELLGAAPPFARLMERTRAALAAAPPAPPPPRRFLPITALGRATVERLRGAAARIAFLGEAVLALMRALGHPRLLRRAEVMRHLDAAGTRAFGLTILLGFLIGVILAFQSANPLRRFGAEIFVPNLVGIALLRELGPLLAGVVLAGRTGSAIAAELGTMTVNEEIDALRIMGIDPTMMLVLPRLIAATLVMPLLAMLMNVAGLAGMTVIMASLGYPWAAVSAQLQQWLSLQDLAGGLFKAACFGAVIAGIGCRAGLAAGRGPRAVGDAATAAVVGGIVAIIALDGIFAVLFYRLGI